VNRFFDFHCPAKLNLFLEINSKTENALHEITSVVVQLNFADHMHVRLTTSDTAEDFFSCDVDSIPVDESNTVMRALALYRQAYSFSSRVVVRLEKNIPPMSGMGGASSNAAYFLKNLNDVLAKPLTERELLMIASQVGADCPLFFGSSPCVVRGFGERIEDVNVAELHGLKKAKFLIFKPSLGIETSWAYDKFNERGAWNFHKVSESDISAQKLVRDMKSSARSSCYFNDFQELVCKKYMELARIFSDLWEYFHVRGCLTGSGSAGFVPLEEDYDCTPIKSYLNDILGENAFIVEARPIVCARNAY
jgi:4-diphosphocytidyl-2C-methyl-D-erythritol kinase